VAHDGEGLLGAMEDCKAFSLVLGSIISSLKSRPRSEEDGSPV
jgi:hypothetical protein